jgi:hypothetical protein
MLVRYRGSDIVYTAGPQMAVCQPYTSAEHYSLVTLFFCFWYSFLLEIE